MTSNTELYDRLGVESDASSSDITKAFRKISKTKHPDMGGDEEEFKKITEAYEVLSDPEKRKYYDRTGRSKNPVTPEKIKTIIDSMVASVVNAQRPDGTTDDPTWENILIKVTFSMETSQKSIRENVNETKRKLRRVRQLLRRFKPQQDEDPVGDALRRQENQLLEELCTQEDALELGKAALSVFKGYKYEMGPDPEGQDEPDPTLRLTSGGVFVGPRGWR